MSKILSYLVSITTILGIPVALYGYFSAQQASRVDRTFEFYKDFRTGELQEAVNLLVDRSNTKRNDINQLLQKGDDAGLVKLQETLVQDPKSSEALVRVVVFYDALGPCVDHLLCDADAAIALLKAPAAQIVSAYGGYLSEIQRTGSPFARGVFTVGNMTAPSRLQLWFPWLARGAN